LLGAGGGRGARKLGSHMKDPLLDDRLAQSVDLNAPTIELVFDRSCNVAELGIRVDCLAHVDCVHHLDQHVAPFAQAGRVDRISLANWVF
jgi:hypothetical protein